MKSFFPVLAIAFIGISYSACASNPKVTKDPSQIVAPFDGRQFKNIEPLPDKSLLNVMAWRIKRIFTVKAWEEVKDQKFFKPEVDRSEKLRIAVINHATALIQLDNMNIMTDPHYSERSSPFSWAGPKRIIQPGIHFNDLPPIDAVVVSHDHYDQLDIPTLKKLSDKWAPKIYVGLGNKPLLDKHGIKNVIEMDWWEVNQLGPLKIQMVPVQHWSARGTGDRRETLWGGFVILGSKKVFFAGDTGFGTGKVFDMIHERIGPLDASLIPIGAYLPREFMKHAHIWPAESVKVHMKLKSKKSLGIHFGTFDGLTDEPIDDPGKRLKAALVENGLNEEDFRVPEFGRTYVFE